MQCMKCGNHISTGQVFCPDCLEEMTRYPVKPGTPVLLPSKPTEAPVKKSPRRKNLSPEEQVRVLKRRLGIVSVVLTLLLIFAASCLYTAVRFIWAQQGKPLPGQNYSTAEPKGPQ